MSNQPVMEEVRDKVAIMTGAASGIGRATAKLLQARGAKVIAEDIDPAVEDLAQDGLATWLRMFRKVSVRFRPPARTTFVVGAPAGSVARRRRDRR